MLIVVLIGTFGEVVDMLIKKSNYFRSAWKFLDWLTYGLFWAVLAERVHDYHTETFITLISILSFFLWLRMLYYFSFSFTLEKVALLIRIMSKMARDTIWFFIIFAIFLMAFSHAIALANSTPDFSVPANTTIQEWMLICYECKSK